MSIANKSIFRKLQLFFTIYITVMFCVYINAKEPDIYSNPCDSIKNPYYFNSEIVSIPEHISKETIAYLMDSAYMYLFNYESDSMLVNKYYSQYDEKGNKELSVGYWWNAATDTFELYYKDEYVWNDNNRLISYILYYWSTAHLEWIPDTKEDYIINTAGYLESNIFYNWSSNEDKWINNYKRDFTYSDWGIEASNIYSDWDTITDKWIFINKQEHLFNASGFETSYIFSEWDSTVSEWKINYKTEYTYDEYGNMIHYDHYADNGDEDLTKIYYRDFTYNDNGKLTSDILYHWIFYSEYWKGFHNFEYFYNDNYDEIEKLSYEWDSYTMDWRIKFQCLTDYDERRNKTIYTCRQWNWALDNWINFSKTEFEYNTYDSLLTEISYFWTDESWLPNTI